MTRSDATYDLTLAAVELRADARKLRRTALAAGNGHAARRLMARALGLDLTANDLLRNAAFRAAYQGPEVPPLRSAAE